MFGDIIFDVQARRCSPQSYSDPHFSFIKLAFYFYVVLCGTVVPFGIIVAGNIYLFIIAAGHIRRMPVLRPIGRHLDQKIPTSTSNLTTVLEQARQAAEIKVVRTFLIVTGVFLLAWTPFGVFILLNRNPTGNTDFSFKGNKESFTFVVILMTNCNAWANTLVYFFMNAKYRRGMRRVLRVRQLTT
ncbi:Dopamine receptor 4 [Holothuria leucospilota]|uniref:Dopamine receptor 4 n=1 Tax=Holothuria leucospilota TaxID=206669 RepID=A0A9Q1CH24_HOLLE|nr:Dopamine receptor 4 [Holothuria leucospilota]